MAHPNGGKGKRFKTQLSFAQAWDLVGEKGYDFRSTTDEKINARQSFAKDGSSPIIVFVGKTQGMVPRVKPVGDSRWTAMDQELVTVLKPSIKLILNQPELRPASPPRGGASRQKPLGYVKPIRISKSRADLEKEFRDIVRKLESVIREHTPWDHNSPDRRTLGHLVHECKEVKLLDGPELQEAFFVNAVRNSLYHPDIDEVTDQQLVQATQMAQELCVKLDY